MLKFPVHMESGMPRPQRRSDALDAYTIPIAPCVHALRDFATTEKRYTQYEEFSAALLACIDQALFACDISAITALVHLNKDQRFGNIPDALRGDHEACVEVAKALEDLACSAHARAVRALSTKPVGPEWITGGDPAEEILHRLQKASRKSRRRQG